MICLGILVLKQEAGLGPAKNIMIVEDEMLIALNIEDTLSQLGHRVVLATTIAEAEQLLDAGDVELAIVDYMVPDGNTEPLMERLQQAGIPFIVCSGMSDQQRIAEATPFLPKPFSSDSLMDAVSALLGIERSPRDLH